MKRHFIYSAILAAAILLTVGVTTSVASPDDSDARVRFSRRNLGGPRLGVTFVPSGSRLAEHLDGNKMGRQLSQFGWHFEYQVIPDGGGPQFVVQLTPLIAGVEYGKVIPGATMAMGIRFPSGYEFGIGPNVTGGTGETSPTSLVIGVGKSLNYGGVSVPLNLVCATNPDGTRLSFIIGYAIDRR